jgi:hypothetical protein
MAANGSRNFGTIAVIALATPAALGIETLVRALLLPPDLARLRQEMEPWLTPFGWGTLALTLLATPLGFATRRAMERRLLAKAEALGGSEKRRGEARFEALFIGTSVPQIPAIFATFALTAGSRALPVLLAVFTSSAAVLAIALLGRSSPASPRTASSQTASLQIETGSSAEDGKTD